MIQAIETVYNGYRFRSRLEARWAVFFDAAGIKYQYEPEGFQVDFGDEVVRYLPDFYLPDFDCYAEVKPTKDKLYEESNKLGCMIDFGASPISRGLLILGQIPNHANRPYIPMFIHFYWENGAGVGAEHAAILPGRPPELWLDRSWDGGVYETQELPYIAMGDDLWSGFTDLQKTIGNHTYTLDDLEFADYSEKLAKAFDKARQARFEHGETP